MICESKELQELMERNGLTPGTFCFIHNPKHPAYSNPWPRVSGWISRTGALCLDLGEIGRPGWNVTHRWSGFRVGEYHSEARNAVAFIADLEAVTSPNDWAHVSREDMVKHGLPVVVRAIRAGYP